MKINLKQRKEIQSLIQSGVSKTKIANQYNLNLSTVYSLLNKAPSICKLCNKDFFKTNRTMLWCSDKCRFWYYVDIKEPLVCWPWLHKFKTSNGYGRFKLKNNKSIIASKYAYQISFGDIPEGLEIRHKCDNPICCNPHHLELGTRKDNMQDASKRKRIRNGKYIGCKRYKVTLSDLSLMKKLHEQGVGYKTIQKTYFPNLHFTTVAKHVNDKISKPKS